jgi:hypothetical protein
MARIRFVGFVVLLSGCAPVPELSFGEDDSAVTAEDAAVSADASVPPPDIVSDSATPPVDAPSKDASDAPDASGSLVCPSTPPPAGITKCCGATACVDRGVGGLKCADCTDCNQQKCPEGNFCCYRPGGNFNCRKNLADCK